MKTAPAKDRFLRLTQTQKKGELINSSPSFSFRFFKFNKYFQNPREPRDLKALHKSSCRAKRKPKAPFRAPHKLQAKLIPVDLFICGNVFFLKFPYERKNKC